MKRCEHPLAHISENPKWVRGEHYPLRTLVYSPVVVHSISHPPPPRFAANPKSITPPQPPPALFYNPNTNNDSQSISLPRSADSTTSVVDDDDDDAAAADVDVIKLGKNARRITCRISVDANLETVWNVLTDYERLADFIPGLAVCELLEKDGNRARLFQIGQQNLAFGVKFNAKGIVDCYEKDLESFRFGQRRDIEFKMIEGDFQVFEGKWSIEEIDKDSSEVTETCVRQDFQTILSYVVDVKPKLWLPVGLVEGRLCREIRINLVCIKQQAQKNS